MKSDFTIIDIENKRTMTKEEGNTKVHVAVKIGTSL